MAMLVLIHEGLTLKRIQLEKSKLRIGRRSESDVFIDDMLVSQNHAIVEMRENLDAPGGADFYIRDLDSTNHTYVNGSPVATQKLAHNDVIAIGKHTFKFIDEDAYPGEKTTKLKKSWIPGVYYTKE